MPENEHDAEGFLTRWSRRKQEARRDDIPAPHAPDAASDSVVADPQSSVGAGNPAGTHAARPSAEGSRASEAEAPSPFADVDFDALDYESDYTRFMGKDVPADVRNKALAKLWASNPILTHIDGLDDYCDDYTDAALAVPAGTLKTAYKVGRGFLSDAEVAEWEALGGPETAEAVAAAPSAVAIAVETPIQDEVRALFAASDDYHAALYPAESNHFVSPEAMVANGAVFLVAREVETKRAVACGALLCGPSGEAEIKRMWVDPSVRGTGLGRRILDRLLTEGERRRMRVVRLETGVRQPEALGLYAASGFVERPPFADYAADPNSVFMELALPRGDAD